jgi:hypothetical protein
VIDAAVLRERLRYDPETGTLNWRRKPPGPRRPRAGFARPDGYRGIVVGGVCFLEHRVIWCIVTGEWPEHQVDHRDGDRSNNRWLNLRAATQAQNNQNQALSTANTSGFMGVSRARRGRWRAFIKTEGKHRSLGEFDDPESASAAYLAAKAVLHTFNPKPRNKP